jgi:hypothetical protein
MAEKSGAACKALPIGIEIKTGKGLMPLFVFM